LHNKIKPLIFELLKQNAKNLKQRKMSKRNKMKNHKLTPAQYLKAIELGYYEPIKCVSVFKKIVKHFKVCGRTEILLIDLK